ncbi:hypothetical protein [Escherichia coli]|uniref:hypothetical protein n=1 Tax=Escherichia coli TaxID=562 RepID=UPI00286A00D9|nr:hypothetical protein [Escherichia coli]WMY55209.1 hypothetical protein RHO05_03215 [Escherichia coli]WMY55216.1 hypothetical protein RHO05_03285 [Escherichia coli]WMY55224.1 hypothetical protein RHO05_03355 [Escherichia coli]
MGSCAAPSAKGDDKFITTDYLQQCPFYDLGRNISKSDAKKIQVAYQESLLSPAGYDFRDALSNLLDDKGIIVPAELSYIGTDIYSNSFTKEDWNKLAKIHKKTNKYM